MHMLTKKDLSSGELETIRRFRNPTTVVTANGEVKTNEEVQVYVHDLNLFVTVQLLKDMLALSSGKLCEEHGYTCEWSSGQKPHPTKDGRTFPCKTENFVPVVVPGLSSSSSASSSSTSLAQDSSSSSNPANLRSDEGVLGNWRKPPETQNRNKNGNDKGAAGDRLQDLRSGWRTSKKTSKIQKGEHRQTFLMTQIWNVL